MLQKHIEQEQVRHAYLFSGPRGIGRRTLALRFAQALSCTARNPDGSPCGECRVCRQTMQMQHPDLTVIEMAEDKTAILVDQIRELQHVLSRSPFEAQYRIGLLLNFDKATESAQNALLKTLEEAPTQAILLMTVDTVESMLPTIASRCEIMRLRAMKLDALGLKLEEKFQIDPERAQFLAHISGGRIGEALRLAEDAQGLDNRTQIIDELLAAIRNDRNARLDYADKKFHRSSRDVLRDAGQIWLTFWRDVIVRAAGEDAPLLNPDYEQEINQMGETLGLQTAREQVSVLQQTMNRLDANVNVWLLAEVLLLDLPVKD
jgi:DNA polymerase-3 subunit delta'